MPYPDSRVSFGSGAPAAALADLSGLHSTVRIRAIGCATRPPRSYRPLIDRRHWTTAATPPSTPMNSCASRGTAYTDRVGPLHAGTIEPGHFRSRWSARSVETPSRLGVLHKALSCASPNCNPRGHRLAHAFGPIPPWRLLGVPAKASGHLGCRIPRALLAARDCTSNSSAWRITWVTWGLGSDAGFRLG